MSELSALAGETSYRVYDQPTPAKLKIYFDNASLLVDLETGRGEYERVARRPLFFQANVIHRNSVHGWRWVADLFSAALIVLNVSGLFILGGRRGLGGRGKWLVAAGMMPPVAALVVFEVIQK